MLGLVGDVGPEITAYDTVPSWVVFLVELLLDEGSNVFLDVELLHSLGGNINRASGYKHHSLTADMINHLSWNKRFVKNADILWQINF